MSGPTTGVERRRPGRRGSSVSIVDCDVHNHFRDGISDLLPYLSPTWQRRVGSGPNRAWAKQLGVEFVFPNNILYMNPHGIMRRDSIPEDGSPPASDPGLVSRQLLDEYGIDRAVLLGGDLFTLAAVPDPDLAAVLASAYNDWLIGRWLTTDRRFRGALTVAPQDPAQAAAEIDRLGDHEGIVQVSIPMLNVLMGERHYHPIYEAAQRHRLPVSVHPGAESVFLRTPAIAGGVPTYYIEHHTGIPQVFATNLVSLVCHGVFERFPDLSVLMIEGGFAWLPGVLWRLDKNWRSVRDEVPWLRRPPSEYVFEHVRFTTQPFVEAPSRAQLASMAEMIDARRTLLFSSDYPHWDFDDPFQALRQVAPELRQRIMAENALELYGDRIL